MSAPALYLRAVAPMPPVPSLVPVYLGTVSTTTDETTSTFSLDLGVPHPKRIIVLGGIMGAAAAGTASTVTVNGNPFIFRAGTGVFAWFACLAPQGYTGEIVATHTGSIRKALAVFAIYPENPLPISSGFGTAATTGTASASGIRYEPRGYHVYFGGANGILATCTTTTNTGVAIVESVDAQIESTATYTAGYFAMPNGIGDFGTVSGAVELVLDAGASATKLVGAIVWGPPTP